MEIRQYIYISKLNGSIGETGLRQIMQRSREKNLQQHLTGALLFDGESFVQLIEGSSDNVLAIVEAIRDDPRHVEFTTLCSITVESTAARRCTSWGNGYIEAEALDQFRSSASAVSPEEQSLVLDRFIALLETADVI